MPQKWVNMYIKSIFT